MNDRKAYHVATAASDIVWGGEHGWERDEVGEHDLARALRKYVRDLKKQNGYCGYLNKTDIQLAQEMEMEEMNTGEKR
jgi:hypothetical protein